MPLHERDIYSFVDVTLTYLNKITGNEITLRDPTIEFQSLIFSAYTGLIHVEGDTEGFVYLTSSQQFLQQLHTSKHNPNRLQAENCSDVMQGLIGYVAHQLQQRFASTLTIAEPVIFSTVPDDPIEMPPAVFVQPLVWRKEFAYLVLGLSSPETPEPNPPS